MKKSIFFSTLSLIVCSNSVYSQRNIDQGLKQITPQLIKDYVEFIASDKLLGRNTPSPELDTAASFIVNQFKLFGIKPVNGSYFQNIPFCTKDLDIHNCLLRITVGGESKEFNLKTDFIPF